MEWIQEETRGEDWRQQVQTVLLRLFAVQRMGKEAVAGGAAGERGFPLKVGPRSLQGHGNITLYKGLHCFYCCYTIRDTTVLSFSSWPDPPLWIKA